VELVDGYTHRPKHHGIDFQYDQAKKKMKVSLCFCRAMPGNGHIQQLFGLAPSQIPVDLLLEDLDGSSTDSSVDEGEPSQQAAIILQWLDLLANDDYLLRVHRVLNQQTHVVVTVQESTHTDFVVGSEQVLTMDEAVQLYREYHDIY
jgi:hypothetical protein